jgi:hypothetical protein
MTRIILSDCRRADRLACQTQSDLEKHHALGAPHDCADLSIVLLDDGSADGTADAFG